VTLDWPVNEVPGDKPMSPVMVLVPVFVMVEPAKTAKLSVVPRFTVGWAAMTSAGAVKTKTRSIPKNMETNRNLEWIFTINSDLSIPLLFACEPKG
jgi:hypothetical protein